VSLQQLWAVLHVLHVSRKLLCLPGSFFAFTADPNV
jgi:hypothetical protein